MSRPLQGTYRRLPVPQMKKVGIFCLPFDMGCIYVWRAQKTIFRDKTQITILRSWFRNWRTLWNHNDCYVLEDNIRLLDQRILHLYIWYLTEGFEMPYKHPFKLEKGSKVNICERWRWMTMQRIDSISYFSV